MREAFKESDRTDAPNVVFAYTLKGYRLPSVGDPQNHSVTLSDAQMEELRDSLDLPTGERWPVPDDKSEAGILVESRSKLLASDTITSPLPTEKIPWDFGRKYSGNMSTQQIFGLVLTDMSRTLGEISKRVVTVSPDVASSTNLGGWINRVGVWKTGDSEDLPGEDVVRALRWDCLLYTSPSPRDS